MIASPFRGPILTVLFREDPKFELIRTERGRRLPGGTDLRRRRIDETSALRLPIDTEELVTATVDADGGIRKEFAWLPQAVAFRDRAFGGFLQGKRSKRRASLCRRVALPIGPHARFVLIYRERVRPGPVDGRPVVERVPSALLWLRRRAGDARPAAPTIAGFPVLPEPLEVPFLRPRRPPPALGPGEVLRWELDERDPDERGGVARVVPLMPREDLSRMFDIVIVAEGFTLEELPEFERQAETLWKGMLSREPFASIRERINVHVVSTYSRDSGVANYPIDEGRRKRTIFRFTNDFDDSGTDGYYGTHHPEILEELVTATIGPASEIDLVVVVVNCPAGNGHAYPDLRVIAVAKGVDDTDEHFVDLAMHEAGHVVAELCDEYVSGIPWRPTEVYKNLATQEDVDNGTVWWWPLTTPQERDGRGRFRLVFSFGAPVEEDGYREPVIAEEEFAMLGLFWGCQFADPPREDPTVETAFYDPQGRSFYRPMARCLMRRPGAEFCRACAEAIRQAVLEVTDRGTRFSRTDHRRTRPSAPSAVEPLAARPTAER